MSYPLPVSPHDPAFRSYCQQRQLCYIAVERWRMERAAALPVYTRGESIRPEARAAWDALNLHPATLAEIAARRADLDRMEAEARTDSGWLDWTADIGAMLHNRAA